MSPPKVDGRKAALFNEVLKKVDPDAAPQVEDHELDETAEEVAIAAEASDGDGAEHEPEAETEVEPVEAEPVEVPKPKAKGKGKAKK